MAVRRRGKGAEREKRTDRESEAYRGEGYGGRGEERERERERSDTKRSRECDGRMIPPIWKRTERRQHRAPRKFLPAREHSTIQRRASAIPRTLPHVALSSFALTSVAEQFPRRELTRTQPSPALCRASGIRGQRQAGDVPRRANMARMYRRSAGRNRAHVRTRQDCGNVAARDGKRSERAARSPIRFLYACRRSFGRYVLFLIIKGDATRRETHRNAPRRFDFYRREINTRMNRAARTGDAPRPRPPIPTEAEASRPIMIRGTRKHYAANGIRVAILRVRRLCRTYSEHRSVNCSIASMR
jgi:hypothetical protein